MRINRTASGGGRDARRPADLHHISEHVKFTIELMHCQKGVRN
jgi:hypothetical protein